MSYTLCDKIRNLKPYEPNKGEYKVRLDANESFVELSESTRAELAERITGAALNRYPDPLAAEACGLFARYYGVGAEYVTAGNGSDELLGLLTQAFLMRGERMTVFKNDFSMYGFYGSIAEVQVDCAEKTPDGRIDPDALIDRVNNNGSRLLIFSNPCNPTGLGISADEVLRIVDGCSDCLVVVDEAYMDFWDQSVLRFAPERENMIVLRTCSKALRTAGIRCGFAVAGRRITDALRAVKSPYNVSRLTQEAAAAIFSHPQELDGAIAQVIAGREQLGAMLGECLATHPGAFAFEQSSANFFMLVFPGDNAQKVFDRLKERGIVVRFFSDRLRVTVGSPEENELFIKELGSIL